MGEGSHSDEPPRDELSALGETILRALDHAAIGISITSQRGGKLERLHSNAALARIAGYSHEEIQAVAPLDLLAEDERPRMMEIYRRWLAGEEIPQQLETAVAHKDGSRVPVEVGLASTTYRDDPAAVVFMRDISERQHAAEALRRSEARFRQLAEAAPDVITVFSEGKFVYANPAAARVLGYRSVKDFLATPPSEWLPEGERERMQQRIGQVMAGEVVSPTEYVGRRSDGSFVALEVSSIRTEFEDKPAVLAFGREVDERKRVQSEMLEADRMATVGTLATGVAHEINNPLTWVLFNLQRLQQELPSLLPDAAAAPRIRELIEEALEGSERVRVIVKDLLSFARSDSAELEGVRLEPVVRSALKLADNTLRHRAEARTELGDVPLVMANEARLGQVLLNLLVNAGQAFEGDSTEGNRVTVSARSEPEVGRVVVSVEDNGRGIPREHLRRVFDPFFTTKPAGVGTGLGLTICRSIVESFGGDLSIASTPGEGTRVQLTLPIADRARARTVARTSAPATQQGRVMIVDDEPVLARTLASALGAHHDVETFSDSRAALARLLEGPSFDVVVCDLVMPDLTGVDLYEQVADARPLYRDRFVFITGGPFTPRASEFVARTAVPVLAKPFDLETLEATVARCMAAR